MVVITTFHQKLQNLVKQESSYLLIFQIEAMPLSFTNKYTQGIFLVNVILYNTQRCQTSNMELLVKIIND